MAAPKTPTQQPPRKKQKVEIRKRVKYKKAGRLPDGFRWFKPVLVPACATPANGSGEEDRRSLTPYPDKPCKTEARTAETKSMQFPTPGPNHPSVTTIVAVPSHTVREVSQKRRKRKGGRKDKNRKRRRTIRTVHLGPQAFMTFPAARMPRVFTGNDPKNAVELSVQFLATLCANQKQAAINVYGSKYPTQLDGIQTVLDQLTEIILDPNQTLVGEGDLTVVEAPTFPNPENGMNARALKLLRKQNEELDNEIQELEELKRSISSGALFSDLGLKIAPRPQSEPPSEKEDLGLPTSKMNRQVDDILAEQRERLSKLNIIEVKIADAVRDQRALSKLVGRTSTDFRPDLEGISHFIVDDFISARKRAIEGRREKEA